VPYCLRRGDEPDQAQSVARSGVVGSVEVDLVVVNIDVRGCADVDADWLVHHFAAVGAQPADLKCLIAGARLVGELGGSVCSGCQIVAQPVGGPPLPSLV
jgi:hypothetical protein